MRRQRAVALVEQFLRELDAAQDEWPVRVVTEVYVFGSFARGAIEPGDVDIDVEYDTSVKQFAVNVVYAASRGLGHDGVEAGWVDVAGDRDGASLVCGVDQSVERFGGVLACGQHADVVDDGEVHTAYPGDRAGHGAVDLGPGDGLGQRFQGE
jgi:hypothetical protein